MSRLVQPVNAFQETLNIISDCWYGLSLEEAQPDSFGLRNCVDAGLYILYSIRLLEAATTASSKGSEEPIGRPKESLEFGNKRPVFKTQRRQRHG